MAANERKIEVGDTVSTAMMLMLVDAHNPETGEWIEVSFSKWHPLKVCGLNEEESTIDVELPEGFIATLSMEEVQ